MRKKSRGAISDRGLMRIDSMKNATLEAEHWTGQLIDYLNAICG